jgi:hypothetical protein
MNRDTILTEVRDIVGEESADFWTDAELVRYINEGQRRFNGEMTWPWLVTEASGTLASGVNEYELPEGIDLNKAVNLLMNLEGETLTFAPVRVTAMKGFQLRRVYGSATASRPLYFYTTSVVDGSAEGLFTTTLRFVPTPTGTVEMEYQYYRVVDDMTAGSDIPDLPVEYHKALVHYAAGTAWLKELNGGPKAKEQFELYQKVLAQATQEFFSDPTDQPLVMGQDHPQYGRFDFAPGNDWDVRLPETLGP